MKSSFWRVAALAVALSVSSGQAFAHGHRHYHGGYYGGSGWWIGGALLGAGVALALSNASRNAYSGVTYVSPPVYYSPGPYMAPPVTYVSPAPRVTAAPSSLNVIAYPAKGQSQTQQAQDRHACENWAMNQSGLDPANISEYTTSVSAESYTRAMGACFKGRGYSIN